MNDIRFAPRRLGHVNLWVSDLEQSIRFYEYVCGIELVRRERAIKIGFHSNGNTHHDIGLVETSKGYDRVGRDGKVQIPAHRGTSVGLNHLGWEMENEAELVAAYVRSKDDGRPRAVDHLISHSVYLTDADGNGHEFYADALHDWRSIYNLDREDEVTGEWDPESSPPVSDRNYNVDPPLRKVAGAAIHPRLLTGAVMATSHFDAQDDFFGRVAGLARRPAADGNGRRRTVYAGTVGRPDLTLEEVPAGDPTGLRSFVFDTEPEVDMALLERRCAELGVPAPVLSVEAGGRRVSLTDPDGYRLAFALRG